MDSKLSKQRIDRILTRYYETLQSDKAQCGAGTTKCALTQEDNVTLVSGDKWDSAQVHRRKNIVKRILVDFQKRDNAPQPIPVQIV